MLRLLPKQRERALESVVTVIAIVEPLSTLPQIIDIFRKHDAHSVSLLSWLLFAGASFVWLAYGLKIKSIPLIVSSIMWIATELTLILGILKYS